MDSFIDLHTHSISSGHAYSTITEMAMAAKNKNITLLGISDHAPGMPGSCHKLHFANLKIMPRQMFGVEMFYGVEANIINYAGDIDLNEIILDRLDYVIASLHLPCVKPGSLMENTNALLGAMKNPYVAIIGHPDDSRYPIDIKAVVEAAKKYKRIIELNNSSLTETASRKDADKNDVELLKWCKEFEVPILIGSDAHYHEYIGGFGEALEIIKQCSFPKELILNYSREKLFKYLPKKNGTLL